MSEEAWSRHASWHLVLPPSRPMPHELDHARKHLKTVPREAPVAVMGSTPEFRDLLSSLGFLDVHIVDSSAVFYETMTQLRAYRSNQHETFHHEHWQTHFGAPDQYAAIISDLTLGNVPYDDRSRLYRAISDSLRPGGLFIDKVLTNEGDRADLENIRDRFHESPINLRTVNDFNCVALFCSELVVDGIIDSTHSYGSLSKEFSGEPNLMELLRLCESITPRGMRWFYGHDWSIVSRDYVSDLSLVCRNGQPRHSAYFNHAYQFIYRKDQ